MPKLVIDSDLLYQGTVVLHVSEYAQMLALEFKEVLDIPYFWI